MQVRPLEVALVCPNIVGGDGQGRIMLEIARSLARKGHRVFAYATSLAEELRSHDLVKWERIAKRTVPNLVADFTFALAATRALRRRRHDVVCLMGASGFPDDPAVYYACFSHRGWRSAWRDGPASVGLYHRLHMRTAGFLEKRCVGRAVSVIAMSETVAAELHPLMRAGASVAIVPGGVDLDEFREVSAERRSEARRELGLEPDVFAIAFIGEYATGRKGLDCLARAVARGGDPAELILVQGDGPRAATLSRLASVGAVAQVFPYQTIPVPTILAASDVVAIPSLYEPFSLVALEAAASGLPIVISSRAGAAARLGAADAAVLVDPTDPAELRAGLDEIKNDPRQARDLGRRARREAEKFAWPAVSERAVAHLEQTALAYAGSPWGR